MKDTIIKYDCPWCHTPTGEIKASRVQMTWFQDGETHPHVHVPCPCGAHLNIAVFDPDQAEILRRRIPLEQQVVDTKTVTDWAAEFLDRLDRETALSSICESEVG